MIDGPPTEGAPRGREWTEALAPAPASPSRLGARARRWQRATIAVAILLGTPATVQSCSAYHLQRARAERVALGDRLYVERAGPATGPAVVYLSGMMGTTTYWREAGALELADDGFRVLLVDELGFGRSPWPDGDYTLEAHLAAIERTLVAEGAQRDLILVGHSFGALLAAEYGARHTHSVRQVILFGTPLFRGGAEARQRIGEMSALAGLTARNSRMARLVCGLHAAFPGIARVAPLFRRDLPPEVVVDGALHFWPSIHGSVENVVVRHSIEPALAVLGSRVTFVHGSRDRITPMTRLREVATASGASVVATGDDHVSYWRNAAQVVRSRVRPGDLARGT